MNDSIKQPAFSDAVFERHIREIISKPDGEITRADLAAVTKIWHPPTAWKVADLAGIEHCVNVKTLFIGTHTAVDLNRIKNLTSLETLALISLPGADDIPPPVDFSPLAGLTNLKNIITDLHQNSDFGTLSALSFLDKIKLDVDVCNDASDLSQLGCLTNLKHLSVTFFESAICDIAPIGSLINLKSLELRCQDSVNKNIISDIAPLRNLTKLEDLTILHNDNLHDLSPVSHVKNVKTEPVAISFPVVTSADNLPQSQSMAGVPEFHDAAFERIVRDALGKPTGVITSADMARIEKLRVTDWSIADLAGIEFCVNVHHLEFVYFNVSDSGFVFDISRVGSLRNLRKLRIHSENVRDICALSGLTNLTNLYLDINASVTDISALSGLSNLTQLVLIQSGVTDLRPLCNLRNLSELWLAGAEKDLSPVSHVRDVKNIRANLFRLNNLWDALS